MARPTRVYAIEYVATLIGENIELLQQIASNSDNIDFGEMIVSANFYALLLLSVRDVARLRGHMPCQTGGF